MAGLLDGYAYRPRGLLDSEDPVMNLWHNLPDQGGGNLVPRPTVRGEADQLMREWRGEVPSMAVNVVRGFTESPAAIRAYHGSFSGNIDRFDNSALGREFNNRTSRLGHWFSTNPDDAAFYGDRGYEVSLSGKYKPLPSMEEMASSVIARLERTASNPRVQMETRQAAENYLEYVRQTRDPAFYTNVAGAHINKARTEGFNGARLVGGETVQNISKPGDNYVVFDPSLIEIVRRYGLIPVTLGGGLLSE